MPCLRANNILAVSIPGQCPLEKLLDPCVAKFSVTERLSDETCRSKCKALFKDMVKTGRGRTPANRYSTGKTKSSPETGVGQSTANVI